MADPTWPAILTDGNWQKNKGAISKLVGKTGVGEAMTAAKSLFDKIEFTKMFASDIKSTERDATNITARKKQAGEYHKSTIEPARTAVKNIKDKADDCVTKFKANVLVPKSSREHAKKVASAAELLWMELKNNSTYFDDAAKSFDTMLAVKQKAAADEAAKLGTTITNLETALKATLNDLTVKGWSEGSDSTHQRCRSMCNAIRNIPALKAKYWKTWKPYGDEYHKDVTAGAKDESDEIKKKVASVVKSLAVFKANYKADMLAG